MKKIPAPAVLLIPLLLLVPTLIYLSHDTLILFPDEKYYHQFSTSVSQNAADQIEEFYYNQEEIYLRFHLKKAEGYPYAGLVIWLDDQQQYHDLRAYDYLLVEIKEATYKEVVIFLKTYLAGVSKPERQAAQTLRHNEFTLLLKRTAAQYKIPLGDFVTPDWWYELLAVPAGLRQQAEDFKQTVALDFQFMDRHTFPFREQSETITITRLAFHKRYPLPCLLLACLAGCCWLGGGAYLFLTRSKKNLQPAQAPIPGRGPGNTPGYKPLSLGNYADDALARLNAYIKEHYQDPRISIGQITQATGIPQFQVSGLIKKAYHVTCKQLINSIRITEAQRLLAATDRRIVEIALELGFNDITTFNRCFKKVTGKSPRAWRTGL